MRRVSATALCLLAVLIGAGTGTTAGAQAPATPRIGALIVTDRLVGSGSTSGALDTRIAGPRYAPHRHWSWLFPNTPVPPFASDPLMRRHWWLHPMLRRHWWK